jgi:hypothetical protein
MVQMPLTKYRPEDIVLLQSLSALPDGSGVIYSADLVNGLESRVQEFISWLDRFPAPVGIRAATAARGLKVGPLAVPLSPEKLRELDEFRDWFKGWL